MRLSAASHTSVTHMISVPACIYNMHTTLLDACYSLLRFETMHVSRLPSGKHFTANAAWEEHADSVLSLVVVIEV